MPRGARRSTGRVGVIGTVGTIASGAYQRAAAELAPDRSSSRARRARVRRVRRGRRRRLRPGARARRAAARAGDRAGVDTLVLGCTHYPLLARTIGDVMGPDVVLVSSADETAFEVRGRLGRPTAVAPVRATACSSSPAATSTRSAARRAVSVVRRSTTWRRGRGADRARLLGLVRRARRAARAAATSCAPATRRIWMDCGNGSFANLQQHVDPADLTAVVITHGHPDHCVDLYGLHVMYRTGSSAAAFRCTRPKGVETMLEGLVGRLDDTFDWRIVGDGDTADDRRRGSCASRAPTTRRPRSRSRSRTTASASSTRPTPARSGASTRSAPAPTSCSRRRRTMHDDIRAPIHLSARQAGELRARRAGAAADAHPLVADARPGSLRRRGVGGVRAAPSRSPRRTSAPTSERRTPSESRPHDDTRVRTHARRPAPGHVHPRLHRDGRRARCSSSSAARACCAPRRSRTASRRG